LRPREPIPELHLASRARSSSPRRFALVVETSGARSLTIREATDRDRDAIWEIFRATVAPGDSFVYDPKTPREEAEAYWFAKGTRTYVAEREGRVVGSYILRDNRPGLGNHVSNAGFMVAPAARRF